MRERASARNRVHGGAERAGLGYRTLPGQS
jgi:hypothetical protein